MATSQQKFQVSELSGMMLDLACAKFDERCADIRWEFRKDHYVGFGHDEGCTDEYIVTLICDPDDWKYRIQLCVCYGLQQALVYSPSTMWAKGGVIIQDEKISIWPEVLGDWLAVSDGIWRFNGDTPLTAAMRAFVASKASEIGGAA